MAPEEEPTGLPVQDETELPRVVHVTPPEVQAWVMEANNRLMTQMMKMATTTPKTKLEAKTVLLEALRMAVDEIARMEV